MRSNNTNRATWRFFDGSVSISASMLLAVAIDGCANCHSLPVLGLLQGLTQRNDGLIIVATLLLFPVAAALWGGLIMFFAAKEFVENRAAQRAQRIREEGREAGRKEERERISKMLEQHGVPLTPEQAKFLANESE